MRSFLGPGWGVLLIALGTVLLGWIAYNLFVEMQPGVEGRSPILPTLFALSLIGYGVTRLRRRRPDGGGDSEA